MQRLRRCARRSAKRTLVVSGARHDEQAGIEAALRALAVIS